MGDPPAKTLPTASCPLFCWPCTFRSRLRAVWRFSLQSRSSGRASHGEGSWLCYTGHWSRPTHLWISSCSFPVTGERLGPGESLILWPWPDPSLAVLESSQLPSGKPAPIITAALLCEDSQVAPSCPSDRARKGLMPGVHFQA